MLSAVPVGPVRIVLSLGAEITSVVGCPHCSQRCSELSAGSSNQCSTPAPATRLLCFLDEFLSVFCLLDVGTNTFWNLQ